MPPPPQKDPKATEFYFYLTRKELDISCFVFCLSHVEILQRINISWDFFRI